MPFLRVASVDGKVVSLNKAGEGIHTLQAQTYAWTSENNLRTAKCLIISEGGRFSGRVTTVTANNNGTVTLHDVGELGFGDFLLPAPPASEEFGYLGTFYMDTQEVRNIHDTGSIVRSRGIFIQSPSTNGKIASPMKLDCSGYISPLATGVMLDSSANISTSSTGQLAEYFAGDGGNHTAYTGTIIKTAAASLPYYFTGILVAFLYPGELYYSNGGADAITNSRINSQMNINGYIEA